MTPPLAVPSSLVRVMPVRPTASLNSLAWLKAFWPVPASRVSMISWGASSSSFFITRTTFLSSSIRLLLFCRRPAVSAINTSAPRERAASMASKMTEAESAPVCWAITGILLRWPHTCSCSTAAARKVSPAASMTLLPSAWNCLASLPMVVVLPTPFTPTIRMT